jgi:peptide/nickel transport system substrate-binding protein
VVDEEPTEEVAAEAAEAAEGGELRVALPREPATLDPVFAVVSDAAIFGAFIEPLILPDPTMEPTSDGLMTDWERVDETTWQFEIREGVEFHNGEPLDAEAVAWNVLNNRDAEGILSSFFASIEDATAVDEHTLEVTTTAPNNSLVSLFMVTYVVPPGYYQEVGSDGFSEEPVGTGPFLYADRAVGERMSAERNPDYWGGPANLDAITWTYAGDGSTRANLLMTGDVDVEFSVAFEALDSLLAADGVDITTYESLSKVSLFLVDDRPPLEDDDLREAVAKAIDRDLIAEEFFGGDGVAPSRNLLDVGEYGATEPHGFGYDPDAARELVEGAATEPDLPMISVIDRGPRARDVGEALAGMLEAVGFNVERDPRPYAEMVEDALSQNVSGLYVHPKTSLAPHPFFWTNGFLTTDSLTQHCSDPRFDELATEALAAPTPEEGAEVYTEIDDIALTQNICIVPVFDEVSHLATVEGVTGLEMRADGLPMDFASISRS